MIAKVLKLALPYAVKLGLQRKQPQYWVLTVLMVLLLAIALIFALMSLHQYLRIAALLPAYQVNGLFALGFVLLACVVFLVIAAKKRRHKQNALFNDISQTANNIKANAQMHLKNQANEMQYFAERSIEKNAGSALAAAVIVGLIMGVRAGRK